MGYVNRKLKKQSQLLLDNIKNKPYVFGIEITTRCPLKCTYCDRSSIQGGGADLELTKLQNVIRKINAKTNVLCGLGEATIHRNFSEVQKMLDCDTMLITSGSIRLDWDLLLVVGKIKFISISLDSPRKETMELISKGYDWESLLYNLEKARQQNKIFVMVNATINEKNCDKLLELVQFAYHKGIRSISINYPILDDLSFFEKYGQLIKEQFKLIDDFMKRTPGIIVDYPGRYKCFVDSSIVSYVDIMQNLYPCCYAYNLNYSVGNLADETFEQIWENEKYERFRSGELCRMCIYTRIFEMMGEL